MRFDQNDLTVLLRKMFCKRGIDWLEMTRRSFGGVTGGAAYDDVVVVVGGSDALADDGDVTIIDLAGVVMRVDALVKCKVLSQVLVLNDAGAELL